MVHRDCAEVKAVRWQADLIFGMPGLQSGHSRVERQVGQQAALQHAQQVGPMRLVVH